MLHNHQILSYPTTCNEIRSRLSVAGADVDAGEVELDALEVGGSARWLYIRELVALHNVAAKTVQQLRNSSNHAQLIRALRRSNIPLLSLSAVVLGIS